MDDPLPLESPAKNNSPDKSDAIDLAKQPFYTYSRGLVLARITGESGGIGRRTGFRIQRLIPVGVRASPLAPTPPRQISL